MIHRTQLLINVSGGVMRIAALAVTMFALCAAGQQATAPTEPSAPKQELVASEPNTLMSQEKVPSGSRVYVAPMANGFDNYIVAGLQQKKVPVIVVADR